jgi:alpha-N-arabinofuranosidase
MLFGAILSPAQIRESQLAVDASHPTILIDKNIYGHFSEHLGHCIYGGIWVGEGSPIPNTRGIRKDVVAALKKIRIPVLRWPGGCFADEYHWMDGIGPREKRPKMVNTHWGGVVEDNSFGTHEFLDLCEQTGAEPYICGNLGSGSVEEMSKWVEYITSDGESPMANLRKENGRERPWKVKYWGVGNENWGCGGNMTAEFYADQYKRYATYCRNYGSNRLYKIGGGSSDTPTDYRWLEVMMKNVPSWLMSGVSLHYYTVPRDWNDKGSATAFDEAEYFATLEKCRLMEELVSQYCARMDRFDPEKKIGLIVDEWGNWYNVEPGTNPGFLLQQNTMRDALTAATNLNIFNNRADRVRMANIAQLVNVLQAVILTDGPAMILTPTYHVYDLFKVHHDAKLLPSTLKAGTYEVGGRRIPAVNGSASLDGAGKVHLSLVNLHSSVAQTVACSFAGFTPRQATGQALTAGSVNAHNTFKNPDAVRPHAFSDFTLGQNGLRILLPPRSVVVLELDGDEHKGEMR